MKKAPSVKAVVSFYEGEPDGLKRLFGTFLGRALMLSVAYHLVAKKKDAVKLGLIGSATIEAYLLWYFRNKK